MSVSLGLQKPENAAALRPLWALFCLPFLAFLLASPPRHVQAAESRQNVKIDCSESKLFTNDKLNCLYNFYGGSDAEKATQDQYYAYGNLLNGDMISLILIQPRDRYHMNTYNIDTSKEYLRLFNDWTKSGTNWDQYKGFKSTGYSTFRYSNYFCVGIDHAGSPRQQGYSYILRGAYCGKSAILAPETFVKNLLASIRIGDPVLNKNALGEAWINTAPQERLPSVGSSNSQTTIAPAQNSSQPTACSPNFSFSKPPALTTFPPDAYVSSMQTFHFQEEDYDYTELAACSCMKEPKFSNFTTDQILRVLREGSSAYIKGSLSADSVVVKDDSGYSTDRTFLDQEVQTKNAKGNKYIVLITYVKTHKSGQCYAMLISGFEPKNSFIRQEAEAFIARNRNIP